MAALSASNRNQGAMEQPQIPSAPNSIGENSVETREFKEQHCLGVRCLFLALGFLCLGLGIIGVFLPVMPTTVFLLIALWAFGRSSGRFHRWLYHHPTLGATLRAWHKHRVISRSAKCAAFLTMAASLSISVLFVTGLSIASVAIAAILAIVALWIARQPSTVLRELGGRQSVA